MQSIRRARYDCGSWYGRAPSDWAGGMPFVLIFFDERALSGEKEARSNPKGVGRASVSRERIVPYQKVVVFEPLMFPRESDPFFFL